MSIYVEILVRAPIDAVWAWTQTPALHERWDLRFSRIEYLPKLHEAHPQRFTYTTRIGFGFEVSGEGETVGERNLDDGSRASALKFGSAAALSIIREGSGYWKYIPTADGVRFLTCYDYRTRFGAAGYYFDRFIFRPLLGWATAWSFDRLRLWIERRIEPERALRRTVVRFVARSGLVLVLAHQCLARIGLVEPTLDAVWLFLVAAALAAIDLLAAPGTPSAARCLRRPSEKT